jgi:pSer/pThr/pTyr-binding forkhead associated (FHA) protein
MSSTVAGAITSAVVLEDGTRYVLDTERVTIGRQSSCSIVIRDTNVSREHVQLRRRPSGWTLRDIGSTNGTKLNGVRVEGEQMLANGDVIMLGAIKVTFEIS